MNQSKKTFAGMAAAVAMLAAVPGAAFAESAVSDPGNFFAETPEFDPMASGTKYSGTLSIAYVFTEDNVNCIGAEENGLRVSNMFVVLSLQHGNGISPFNSDFRANPDLGKAETPSFCFFGDTHQIAFILEMIRTRVIPSLYEPCVARLPGMPVDASSCPDFAVKSVSNMISSGQGALRADITIAVKE